MLSSQENSPTSTIGDRSKPEISYQREEWSRNMGGACGILSASFALYFYEIVIFDINQHFYINLILGKWPLNVNSTKILVRDYAHYAEAAYGYALFLYKNSNCRGALKLRNMTCLLN